MKPEIKTVGQMLLSYLELEGVKHLFGVPGGGLMNLLEDLYEARDRFQYVICRQETGAAYIADGYYRASGKLGVVMVTSGPGATNALTGVMNAEAASSSVLLLTGEIAQEYYGLGYLQEGIDSALDINDVYKASVASSAVVSAAASAQVLVQAALRTARNIPRHAAHLSLPVNVTNDPVEKIEMPTKTSEYRAVPSSVALRDVSEALTTLAGAARPLILLGNGCREAMRDKATAAAFRGFVEARGIPVLTTADGKGVFPEDHDLSLGMFGLANSIWPYYWMTQTDPAYDALLVVGSGLGELATNKWNPVLRPDGPIIQVDANPRIIARDFPVALGAVGEAGAFLRALAKMSGEALPDPAEVAARKAKVGEIKKDHDRFFSRKQYDSTADPVEPAALCRVMQEELPADGTVVMLDAGNCVGWGAHYLIANSGKREPDGTVRGGFEVHSSLDMGPMGFAVGAVVGAKIARPEATCVCFTGDGAFMMQGSEISTAQRNDVGAIWIVLHDNDLSMVTQGMEHFKQGDLAIWRELYSLGEPDLAKYAEGLGADAYTVSDPETFRTALKKAVAAAESKNRPQVIVAEIDRDAEPPYYNPLYAPPKKQARKICKGAY